MDVAQWIVLGGAVVAVLAVYLYSRRNSQSTNPWKDMGSSDEGLPPDDSGRETIVDPSVAGEWQADAGEASPSVSDDPVDSISPAAMKAEPVPDTGAEPEIEPTTETAPAPSAGSETGEDPEVDSGPQKIVVLHVAARDGARFAGDKLHGALQSSGLVYGERNVYHRHLEEGSRATVFSVANMLKPGTLDPAEAEALRTPGVVMFLQLPGAMEGNKAFQDMLRTAQTLAEELGGVVLDDKRLPLTRQAAQYLIDEIAEFQRQQRLASV